MSSERRAALEAELELLSLEDALVAAKANPDVDSADLHALKHEVRAARHAFRLVHRSNVPRGPGDAVADALMTGEAG